MGEKDFPEICNTIVGLVLSCIFIILVVPKSMSYIQMRAKIKKGIEVNHLYMERGQTMNKGFLLLFREMAMYG